MYCPNCGKEINNSWNNCPNCSSKLNVVDKTKEKIIVIIYIISIILMFVTSLICHKIAFGYLFLMISLITIIIGVVECRKSKIIKILFYVVMIPCIPLAILFGLACLFNYLMPMG